MTKSVGILTAGGDSPGLNAALRGIGKAAVGAYGMQVIGFLDGFRGLMENRTVRLNSAALSGILTAGGTILGTSRDKPHRMPVGSRTLDMTDVLVDNYHKHHLDVLVCLGGGGTHKNAYRLQERGLNIITLPKTIDNDLAMTDTTLGFDTALGIATEAIDRLHSTAHSHHRIIVVEIMGHGAGWLALGAGVAGGADVILIPEIPYDDEKVAEGAISKEDTALIAEARAELEKVEDKQERKQIKQRLATVSAQQGDSATRLARKLEERTRLESRLTILGHLQRGGAPSAADRLLATRLGATCADLVHEGRFGVMIAARGDGVEPVPLEQVVGKRKIVPLDHPWITSARRVGVNLGD